MIALVVLIIAAFAVVLDALAHRHRRRRLLVHPLALAAVLCVATVLRAPHASADPPAPAPPASEVAALVPPAASVPPAALPTIPTPEALAKAQQVLQAVQSSLHQVQQVLGIPTPTLPPAFYDTAAGKWVIWGSFTVGVTSTIAGIVLGAIAAAEAHP